MASTISYVTNLIQFKIAVAIKGGSHGGDEKSKAPKQPEGTFYIVL